MINQFSPPCSYDYDAKIKNENQICKDPVPANINTDILLEIIKMNEIFRSINNPLTPPLIEAVPIPNCKRWESKIEIGFNQMINTFLASFADKLVEINSGSWEKKKEFLSAISMETGWIYPFTGLNDLTIKFVNEKVMKVVSEYVKEEIIDLVKNDSRNYDEIKKLIAKKVEESIFEKDNSLELVSIISSRLSEFDEMRQLKKHMEMNHLPIFVDLYRSHIKENYSFIISRFVEIFDDLALDEECWMSFAFDEFFGEMIMRNKSGPLRDIVILTTHYSKRLLHELSSKTELFITNDSEDENEDNIGPKLSDEFKKFIMQSQKELEDKIKKFLTESDTIVVENNMVTLCKESFMKKILCCSAEYLKKKLILILGSRKKLPCSNLTRNTIHAYTNLS